MQKEISEIDKKEVIGQVLDNKITLKQASEILHVHKETMKGLIIELAKSNSEIKEKFLKYSQKNDYNNINFIALFLDMLYEDVSQSAKAKEISIPARTVSRELEKLSKSEDQDILELYAVCKIHANRHMIRIKDKKKLNANQNASELQYRQRAQKILEKLHQLNTEIYTYVDKQEVLSKQLEDLNNQIQNVEDMKAQGKSWNEIKEETGVDRSQHNRNKRKKDQLQIELESLESEETVRSAKQANADFVEKYKLDTNVSSVSKEPNNNEIAEGEIEVEQGEQK